MCLSNVLGAFIRGARAVQLPRLGVRTPMVAGLGGGGVQATKLGGCALRSPPSPVPVVLIDCCCQPKIIPLNLIFSSPLYWASSSTTSSCHYSRSLHPLYPDHPFFFFFFFVIINHSFSLSFLFHNFLNGTFLYGVLFLLSPP